MPDKPWSEEEKKFLLSEILKGAVSSAYLFSIIKENRITPNWMEFPLPPGRSGNACAEAFKQMETEYAHPQHRPSFPGPIAPMSTTGRKRPLADVHSPQASPLPRAIQPKPPNSFDRYVPAPVAIPRLAETPAPEKHKKRRGRPTKAETERRRMARQNPGEQYPSPEMLTQRRPTLNETTPVPSSETSQSLGSVVQQHIRPEQIDQRQLDVPNLQTHGMHPRQMSGSEMGVSGGTLSTTLPPLGPRESTPRTMLDSRMSQPSVPFGSSLGTPFKILNQPSTESASPEAEQPTFVSNSGVATNPSIENDQSVQGMEEGKDSLHHIAG